MSRFDRIEQSEIEKIAKRVVPAAAPGGGSGTVTQVNSGTGLTGGPITTSGTLSVVFGTSGTTACAGNDSRLTNDRNPTAHASSHAAAGSDPVTLSQSQVTNLTTDLANKSNVGHTHPQSDITNLTTDLAGKASNTPSFVTLAATGDLTNERVLTAGNHVTVADSGAGSAVTVDWSYNPSKRAVIDNDCNAVGDMLSLASGTGAAVNFNVAGIADADHFGICRATTGTTATGRSGLGANATDSVVLGTRQYTYRSIVRIPTVSNGTDTFQVFCGFHDSSTATAVDGLYFTYTHTLNSGNWTVEVYNNSSSITSVNTGVVMTANSWYNLEIVVNPSATSTTFKINGSLVHTFTGTHPSGSARATGFMSLIRKTLGTNARNMDIDYIGVAAEVVR